MLLSLFIKMKGYFITKKKYIRKGFNVINIVNIVLYLYDELIKLSLFFLLCLTLEEMWISCGSSPWHLKMIDVVYPSLFLFFVTDKRIPISEEIALQC